MSDTVCTCGCGTLMTITEARKEEQMSVGCICGCDTLIEPCGCGCGCCAPVARSRDEESAEVRHLVEAAERRLVEHRAD